MLQAPEITQKKRARLPFLMTACLILGTFAIGDRLATQSTLRDLYAKPLTLERGAEQIAVWLPPGPGETQPDGTARPVGGAAVTFGHTYLFELPDGRRVICEHKLTWLWCDGDWRAKRVSLDEVR